jgi:hypothetical protein
LTRAKVQAGAPVIDERVDGSMSDEITDAPFANASAATRPKVSYYSKGKPAG